MVGGKACQHRPGLSLVRFRPEQVIYLAGADIYEDDRYGCLARSQEGVSLRDQLVLNCFAATRIPVAATLVEGDADKYFLVKVDAFARKQNIRWLSKKRQMQGAKFSSNEAYLHTSKPREKFQQRSSW